MIPGSCEAPMLQEFIVKRRILYLIQNDIRRMCVPNTCAIMK
jgi:hypothetical protein